MMSDDWTKVPERPPLLNFDEWLRCLRPEENRDLYRSYILGEWSAPEPSEFDSRERLRKPPRDPEDW